jgi:YegS/Rv2252/BmrU family lipid kinase
VQKATVVFNPNARNAPRLQRLLAAAASLAGDGWQVDVASTDGSGHATGLAHQAAGRGAEVVFACGGDGTINEVLNGLVGTPAALGVIRAGMGDVFGKEAGVPRRPENALRVLLTGQRRRFDLGVIETSAGKRHFLCMAGAGFDADVERRVPRGAKRRLGSTAYAVWAVADLPRYRPTPVQVEIDGTLHECDLYWLLAGNTRSYGGIVDITSQAVVDDGLLDAYLFAGQGPVWLAATALRLAVRRPQGGRGVSFQRIRRLELTTPGLPLQADGEYLGESPATISVAPACLDVLLPAGKAARLFSRSGDSEPLAATAGD